MNLQDRLRAGITTTQAADTQRYASELAATLPDDCTLALHGNLGVGKTTFVQGLARGLGINDSVTSPTFNIFTLYRGPRWTLLHLDAYRLESPQQIEALMIEDFLVSPWCLVIEWPEKIAAWIPANALHLDFSITHDEAHTLRLRPSAS